MLAAILMPALATIFMPPILGRLAVGPFTLTSPDEGGNLQDGVCMAANFIALLLGCRLAWRLGGRLAEPVRGPA